MKPKKPDPVDYQEGYKKIFPKTEEHQLPNPRIALNNLPQFDAHTFKNLYKIKTRLKVIRAKKKERRTVKDKMFLKVIKKSELWRVLQGIK